MGERKPEGRRGFGCGTGCLVAGIGFLLLAGIGGLMAYRGKRQVDPVVERFVALLGAGDFRSAYDMTGEGWRGRQDFDQFADFQKKALLVVGDFREKSFGHLNINASSGTGTTAVAVYNARYSNGDVTLTFNLTKKDGAWLIEGQHYASPLFASAVKCPRCGTEVRLEAKFCPQCGGPLGESVPAPEEAGAADETGTSGQGQPP
jgi:hypothetical protein